MPKQNNTSFGLLTAKEINTAQSAIMLLAELVHAIKEERRLYVDSPWRRNVASQVVESCLQDSFRFLQSIRKITA